MRTGMLKKVFFNSSLYFLVFFLPVFSFSQYILNGSATQNTCNCYTLTPAQFTQSGSVWNSNKINLTNSFDFTFNVNLGCQDSTGADGIGFILQPVSTSLGSTGGGMGFEGIKPSVDIALDTWLNTINNDPYYDHISIQANGVISHGADLAGPVQASTSSVNIEDCLWHTLRIKWNAVSFLMEIYFDGALRLSLTQNIVSTIFNNDPNVYWGFTAATGGSYNLQQFCTALNPDFYTNVSNNAGCIGTPLLFKDSSVSFAPVQSWYWNFGDGGTSNVKNPPIHNYASPGVYQAKLVITGLDGCISDTLRKNITIGSIPVAGLEIFDTCAGKLPRVNDLSVNTIGTINQWTWMVDGTIVSNTQQPSLTNLSPGNHQIKLFVKSVHGCESDTAYRFFNIKAAPVIDMLSPDGCINEPINFSANQLDNATTITQWNWSFGDGAVSTVQNPLHTYTSAGNDTVKLLATASNGCMSAELSKKINIVSLFVSANNDTTIIPNFPFQLSVDYGGNFTGVPGFSWSPSLGLNNTATWNPLATIQNDMSYFVTVTTDQGCVAKDTVNIKVFKGSAIYVPTGFTPNNDGRNEVLRPLYIGITKIYFFRIYNRWGQLVFSSTKPGEGWDGKINGIPQSTGTYIWMLKAVDMAGKIYEMKGASTIIR